MTMMERFCSVTYRVRSFVKFSDKLVPTSIPLSAAKGVARDIMQATVAKLQVK